MALGSAWEANTQANEPVAESVAAMGLVGTGVRAGVSDDRNEETFRKVELFVNFALPWACRSRSGWGGRSAGYAWTSWNTLKRCGPTAPGGRHDEPHQVGAIEVAGGHA